MFQRKAAQVILSKQLIKINLLQQLANEKQIVKQMKTLRTSFFGSKKDDLDH